jgi:hypothetical protein
MNPFDQIRYHLKSCKIDDTLLFLNYLLQASQNPSINGDIYDFAQQHPDSITDFKIEFLSKWLIICSEYTSNIIVAPKKLDWNEYLKLSALYNQINDPFVEDNNLLSFLIRAFSVQLSGQQRILLQSLGSAYLLYEEAGNNNDYNIPNKFQSITGFSIKEFMQLGFILSSARACHYKTAGTLNQSWIDKAICDNIFDKDKVQNFLKIVSCNYKTFRKTANQNQFKTLNNKYILYEFNPLKKYPLIKIHPERWIAPNPELIIDRVTSGIYYDLLDNDSKKFTDKFGKIFQHYIGDLLYSVYPEEKIKREQEYRHKRNTKQGPADWIVFDNSCAIYIECKAIVPKLNFQSLGSSKEIEEYSEKIANAIEQVYKHVKIINSGHKELEPFVANEYRIVILILGRLQGIHTIFFKNKINAHLQVKGISDLPYNILSLQEFEMYLSLVERGISLSKLIKRIETLNINNAIEPYKDMLYKNAIPNIVAQKGKEILDVLQKKV